MIDKLKSMWNVPLVLLVLQIASLILMGLWIQHVEKIEPCPLCITQRLIFITTGVLAIIGIWHNKPKGYGILVTLLGLVGLGVAGWHSWIQYHPIVEECGASMGYLMDNLPLDKWLPMLFQGSGDCSEINWTMFGLSIPNWAFINYIIVIVLGIRTLKQKNLV